MAATLHSIRILSLSSQIYQKKHVYIMGYFNINFHAINTVNESEYEEIIISSGYSPLISIATYEKPNWQKTGIDNILTNNFEALSM